MVLVLNFKGATGPAYAMIPLPIITLLFKVYCRRKFDPHVYYIQENHMDQEKHQEYSTRPRSGYYPDMKHNIQIRFGEPSFLSELPIPMVHDRVQHLLPRLFGAHGVGNNNSSDYYTNTSGNRTSIVNNEIHAHAVTRRKTVRRMATVRVKQHQELQFQSVTEKELEKDESTEGVKGLYKFDEDDDDSDQDNIHSNNYSNDDRRQEQDHHVLHETGITMPASVVTTTTKPHNSNKRFSIRKTNNAIPDRYAPTRPLMQQHEDDEDYYEDNNSSMYATTLGRTTEETSHHQDGDAFELNERRYVAGGSHH